MTPPSQPLATPMVALTMVLIPDASTTNATTPEIRSSSPRDPA
jgi:hypothetical protein